MAYQDQSIDICTKVSGRNDTILTFISGNSFPLDLDFITHNLRGKGINPLVIPHDNFSFRMKDIPGLGTYLSATFVTYG